MTLLTSGGNVVLRLGVIGLGGATKQMMPSLISHPYVRITACTDARAAARERFAADFGATAYETVEALCDSPDVDAVYIATPHQWHKTHAVVAAERGKHIIVEKPMALTIEECDAMIDAADKNGVYIVVGHTHSYDAPIMKMRDIIHSGELGPMSMINTWNYTNYLYRTRRPEELRTDEGGGIIYNQLPHQVDIVRLLGSGPVRSVRSMAWILDRARPTEGSHITFLEFEDGSAASMVYSGYDYFDTDEFHFWVGELGEEKRDYRHASARAALRKIGGADAESALKLSSSYGHEHASAGRSGAPSGQWHQPHFGVTVVSCALGDLRPSADGVFVYNDHGRTEIAIPIGRAFPDKSGVIDELYDAVAGARQPLRNGAWGKATMAVCEAILTSARERKEVFLSHQAVPNHSVVD